MKTNNSTPHQFYDTDEMGVLVEILTLLEWEVYDNGYDKQHLENLIKEESAMDYKIAICDDNNADITYVNNFIKDWAKSNHAIVRVETFICH